MKPMTVFGLALLGALGLSAVSRAQASEADAGLDGVPAPVVSPLDEANTRIDELTQQVVELRKSVNVEKSGSSGFLLTGFGAAGFQRDFSANTTSFTASLSPVLIWRPVAKVLFEAELEAALDEGSPLVALHYAQATYLASDYLTVGAGLFLNPINAFGERLHPAWINRLPDAPLPFGHGGVVSMTELGVQLRGAVPVGPGSVTFAVFVSNGPRLNTGDQEPDEAGLLHDDNYKAVNPFKTVGGRLGYRPLRGFELGVGGEYGRVGPAGTQYALVSATTFAGDLSIGRSFEAIKGALDVHAQYVWSRVDDAEYQGRTWNNWRSGGYAQISYRPLMVQSQVLTAFEPVVRVDAMWAPTDAPMAMNMVRLTVGLDYWVGPTAVIKVAFENTPAMQTSALLAQFGMGF